MIIRAIFCSQTSLTYTRTIISAELPGSAGPDGALAVRKARKSFGTVASGNSRHSDYPERGRHSVYLAPGTRRRPGQRLRRPKLRCNLQNAARSRKTDL